VRQVFVPRPVPPAPPAPPAVVTARSQTLAVGRKPRPKVTADDLNTVVWHDRVKSKPMLDDEVAWEAVLDDARCRLTHDLWLSHPPTRDWVRQRVVKDAKIVPGPEIDAVTPTVQLTLDLELTREAWRELAEAERQVRVQDRMETMGRVVALLTVLLGAVAGYVRLDEATKGYYTGRLRLVALALVGVASAAILGID
jgi:hypothetical protein